MYRPVARGWEDSSPHIFKNVGLFSNPMRHEAGRCGKLLERHEHREKEPGLGSECHESPCREVSKKAPPTPDRAGVRRGSRFRGPWARRQISVRLSVGFRAGGWVSSRKKVGHGFTLRYQRKARANQPGPEVRRRKRQRGARAHAQLLTCRPGWFGGCGFLHGGMTLLGRAEIGTVAG